MERFPIERIERVVLSALSPEHRHRLTDRLYELWSGLFEGLDREAFARTHLFDHTHVVMGFGPAGDLAGFANITPYLLTLEGRRQLILTSGLFNRLEYRGAARLALGGVLEALRIAAKHPGTPVAGVGVATSPIAYHMAGKVIPHFYPHPTLGAPAELVPFLRELARLRNIPFDPSDPWAVQFPVRLANAARLQRSTARSQGSAWMSWYEDRVPDWTTGQALSLWIPVDPRNAVGIPYNLMRYRRSRSRGGG